MVAHILCRLYGHVPRQQVTTRQGQRKEYDVTQLRCPRCGDTKFVSAKLIAAGMIAALMIAGGVSADASTRKTPKKARSTAHRQITLKWVYSMDNCPPCEALKRFVGAKAKVERLSTKPVGVSSFPTCEYSDGTTDNGERIYNGSASLGKSVLFIHWTAGQ